MRSKSQNSMTIPKNHKIPSQLNWTFAFKTLKITFWKNATKLVWKRIPFKDISIEFMRFLAKELNPSKGSYAHPTVLN